MSLKLSITVLVAILFAFHTNGFRVSDWPEISSSDSGEDDGSLSMDESDYWDLLSDLNEILHEPHSHVSNMSSSEITKSVIEDFVDARANQFKQFSRVRGIMKYSIGKRLRGDQLISSTSRNQSWPVQQNVKLNLSYPAKGVGKTLTYVEILVNQSTNLGQAYVVRGGIRQRFISIIVEAYNTFRFNFDAKFYGM